MFHRSQKLTAWLLVLLLCLSIFTGCDSAQPSGSSSQISESFTVESSSSQESSSLGVTSTPPSQAAAPLVRSGTSSSEAPSSSQEPEPSSSSSEPPVSSSSKPEPAPKTSITVYVTKTGEKYHRSGCQYLRKSKIAIDLDSAKLSYGPCSKCNPPR